MLSAPQIIDEAQSLPVDERAHIVDALLRSLNQPVPEIDVIWIAASEARLQELNSGAVQEVTLEQVAARLKARFPK